jgi:two-component system chemotaxis response regulator CheB
LVFSVPDARQTESQTSTTVRVFGVIMQKVRTDPVRVVVVDDSPTVQQLLVAILQEAEGIQVVGTGATGIDAIRLTERMRPDVVTLDLRMPQMDGLEATRHIMRQTPTPIVIVTGTLMQTEVDITFDALRAGALTVVRTPGLADPDGCEKVVQAVRLMAQVPVVHHWGREGMSKPLAQTGTTNHRGTQMIGIAASTGGPGALATILRQLSADFCVPVLVVQHVAAGFVQGLAQWLDGVTSLRVGLANHGDTPQPGTVLLAPDDYHLQVNASGIVELCKEPPYRQWRPSANFLFRSLARAYGPRAAGIVLTGMGDDGAEGLRALRQAGGLTIAQDEASCIVYGMPQEAIARNAAGRELTLDQIGRTLVRLNGQGSREEETPHE